MRTDSSPESDSSCSSTDARSPGRDPQPHARSAEDRCEDPGDSGADCVVPTARAFSSRGGAKPSGASRSCSPAGASKAKCSKKGRKEQISREEEERKKIRRERNKIAAAKCRNRRKELIDTLQAETDLLEDEKTLLQTEISDLLKEKERLEHLLQSHQSSCKLSVDDSGDEEGEEEGDEEGEEPQSTSDNVTKSRHGVDCVPCSPTRAILGNSDILLCASAEERDGEDALRGDDLSDLVPTLEMEVGADSSASVPDIDMGTPFCQSDWETLYKSVASDFDSLSTPVMSSSPSCGSQRSVFSFNFSEIESLAEGLEGVRGGAPEFTKDLHSPTLLAL